MIEKLKSLVGDNAVLVGVVIAAVVVIAVAPDVAPVIVLGGLGYVAYKKGWLDKAIAKVKDKLK